MKTITIFGSSLPVEGDRAYEDARQLGALLAKHGYAVCNGGYGGTMEAAARGAVDEGGKTVGITCALFDKGPNAWIREEVRASDLEGRIKTLVQRANGFVVLPGGTGTLLELAYVLETMNKKFLPPRPVVLLGEFWKPVLEPLKREMERDAIGQLGNILFIARDIDAAVSHLLTALD